MQVRVVPAYNPEAYLIDWQIFLSSFILRPFLSLSPCCVHSSILNLHTISNMSLKVALAALAAGAQLGLAASSVPDTTKLRLVKTSEEDPGQWVTPEEKYERFTSKGIGFIDITDIKEQRVLKALSTKHEDRVIVHAVDFPTELSHVEEANGLIGSSSTAEPQAWVEHLASYHTRHSSSPTGAEAAQWVFETAQGIASANSAITVEQYEHSFNQPSVIARIPGTTDSLGKESYPVPLPCSASDFYHSHHRSSL